jgi:predicted dehydrogenase
MALQSVDAKAMMDAADVNDRQLTIVKQIRYNPALQALKEWVTSGKSGKVFSLLLNGVWNRNDDYYKSSDWRGKKELDGGILYTQFSHFIDILIWLFGDVKEIKCIFQNLHHQASSEFEDQGSVIVVFENEVLGTLHFSINSFQKNLETSLLIIAENGNIKISGQYCDTLEYAQTRSNDFRIDPFLRPVKHSAVYDHFLHGIKQKEYDRKSLKEAYKSVQLIERIYQTR